MSKATKLESKTKKKIMKPREFKKEAKKLGIEVLKIRNTKSGLKITYAAIIDEKTISLAQTQFWPHRFNRSYTYLDALSDWSR